MSVAARIAEPRRPSAWEWVQAALLAANLGWTTLGLGGYRPETKLVTLALTGVLLGVHFVACAVERRPLRTTAGAGWSLLPFLVYALLNVVTVTPVRWLGWLDWFAWANLVAVFWVALNGLQSRVTRRVMFLVLVLLGITAVLMACYQRFVQPTWLMLGRTQAEQFMQRASGSFGIPNSLAGFLILVLPASGALAFRRRASAMDRIWWSWVTAVLAFGLWLTVSRGGWIALSLALVAWPFFDRESQWKRRAIVGMVALAAVASAGAVLMQYAPKVRERFDRLVRDSGELSRPILWRAAWVICREHPAVGGGAGSFNTLFEQHRPAGFVDDPQWAHNDYLNTASDYGAVGIFLLLGGAAMVVVRRSRADPSLDGTRDGFHSETVRRGFGIGVLAFAFQLFVDFHLKIPALALAFAVVAALAVGERAPHPPSPMSTTTARTRVTWLVAAAAVGLLMVPVLRLSGADALRHRARETMDHAVTRPTNELGAAALEAETMLRRATAIAPGHGQAWSDLAYALELQAFAEPAKAGTVAAPAMQAAHRATQLSPVVPEFWIRLGVALDLQGNRDAAEQAFDHARRLAPRNAHAWYYYAYHLSLDTERPEDALRAIATSLSLDPGNGAAEALRVKLNARLSGALTIP